MFNYVLKRILMVIPVLLGVTVIIFLITRVLAPDPAPVVLGEHATEAAMAAWRTDNGLSDPIWMQFINFVSGAIRGDLGMSYYTHQSVTAEIGSRFPATAELAVCAIIFASIIGVALGVISAVRKNRAADHISMIIALIGVSMPIFWSGILLILLFAGMLHVLPSSGRISPLLQPTGGTGFFLIDALIQGRWSSLADALVHLIMPTIALSLYSMAIITRMTRSSMLDTLGEDYVRTAQAKGLTRGRVNIRHALRCAMLPVSTVIGLQFGSLLGGALLTETVFSWPGIGKFAVDSVLKSDFPCVQGIVLLIAVIFVFMNLLVDIIYAYLDPRIKYGASKEA
ncbi:binding-protein-dependent transport systems inner membrane component [Coriobacterium glomerans PW2]|uniref:Binding-protein-dependent transport systems inner membrane component n=1 Tax=Coriobacterium glomerans (strain ATCC 49209 / DSM 20642 / JCM 10262 / PW2) TaxID=700015 RepID=F2NA95_CORGP|nr:binding-protein-dependent transport systems inner membrane component [Coriobacterium glomerans PW2]